MRTPFFPTRAGVIASAALLVSQCAPEGSSSLGAITTPAAPTKASPLQVTLLQPEPIRLDPSQRTQLETARKVLERNAKTVEHLPKNPQSGSWTPQQPMWNEMELAPFRKLKQGVTLTMRLTNTGNHPLTFFFGPDTSCIHLTIRGKGAVYLPYCGNTTLEFRVGQPVILAPGGSGDFVISELKCGTRNLDRWLLTRPGNYQIIAVFTTRVMAGKEDEIPARHVDARFFDFSLKGYEMLTTASKPVVLKVTD